MYYYHQQKIEDFIDELADADDPNDEETQRQAFARAGANPRDFTQADFREIEREVMRRINR
jgi:hypothetical protein